MRWILSVALAANLAAQPIKWPASFEKLAKKASETVDVALDGSTLKMAAKFLSGDDPDQAKARTAVGQLEGIYIKSFEFDNAGEYSRADIDEILAQIKPSEWKRIVNVESKKDGELTEIFVREKDGKNNGFFILAAETKELTVVQILGSISLNDLAGLEGQWGIPRIPAPDKADFAGKPTPEKAPTAKPKPTPTKKDD